MYIYICIYAYMYIYYPYKTIYGVDFYIYIVANTPFYAELIFEVPLERMARVKLHVSIYT